MSIKSQIITCGILFLSGVLHSQNSIDADVMFLKSYSSAMDSTKKVKLINAMDSFFFEIEHGELDEGKLVSANRGLSTSVFSSLEHMGKEKRKDSVAVYQKRLIDFYRIENNKYMASMIYLKDDKEEDPTLKLIFNFVLEENDGKIEFDLPLSYMTRYWKRQKVDLTTYVFRDKINIDRANLFNQKNRIIADKMKQEPAELVFYMTENYKELNELMGFEYEMYNAGRVRDGYGVDANTIFAIQNNEDFSHDIFHFYSGKVNKRVDRNWVTEEGLAYLWGNAYYTDFDGEMIDQELLVWELKKYMMNNPEVSLLELFDKNPRIFTYIAPEAKVRSVISGLICEEVELKLGWKGIDKMINAGSKKRMDKYMIVIDKLLSINKENFDVEVKKLLENKNAPGE